MHFQMAYIQMLDMSFLVQAVAAYSDKCHIQHRFTLSGHQGQVWNCKFATNGKTLASCSSDKNVILWDPVKCTILLTISGHTRYITTVSFSANGFYLATGSNDRTVQVWKLNIDGTGLLNATQNGDAAVVDPASVVVKKKLATWQVDDVCKWLGELCLQQYSESFRSNAIDGHELSNLTSQVLQEDLGIAPLGHRNKILREIKRIKTEELDGTIPDEFLCPITREIMSDPVLAADGFSYERKSITAWIESGKTTSPMTNSPLTSTTLTPNRSLKNAIMRFYGSSPAFIF